MRYEGSQGKAPPLSRRRMTPPSPMQNSYTSFERERKSISPNAINTTPQMTCFRGAKRVHKIATGKSYDELLQHDNKITI